MARAADLRRIRANRGKWEVGNAMLKCDSGK